MVGRLETFDPSDVASASASASASAQPSAAEGYTSWRALKDAGGIALDVCPQDAVAWPRGSGGEGGVDVGCSHRVGGSKCCLEPPRDLARRHGRSQDEQAMKALGAKYDVKAFNDTVVLGGNVPLDVLARNVDEYIRSATG